MKAIFKKVAAGYFLSSWLPATLGLLLLIIFYVTQLKLHLYWVAAISFYIFLANLAGVFASAVVQFVKRRIAKGLITIGAFAVIGFLFVGTLGAVMFDAMLDERPDNFGKDIVIPADMKISDPVDSFDEASGVVTDKLTQDIVAAFSTTDVSPAGTKISTDVPALNDFGNSHREKLIRYLSSSPKWFVTEERGKPYAYRRLVVNGKWQNELNGFFTDFEVGPVVKKFQTRIVIGFDGSVFSGPFSKELTTAKVGTGLVPIQFIDDREMNQGKESYFVLQSTGAALEIFEQSGSEARPLTQLAVADVKEELEAALSATNDTVDEEQIVQKKSEPEIQLANGFQGGIYEVRAFVNPGEAGKVYIKVFEATRNTPLSEEEIKPRSVARIGWSSNTNEVFRYQSEITVYEGDWGTYYPGRFELWFVPDSGAPERKLIDRIFRIEGWMR